METIEEHVTNKIKFMEAPKSPMCEFDKGSLYELKIIRELIDKKKVELSENQQIVLDVLKKNANQGLDELIVGGVAYLNNEEIDAIELSSQSDLYEVFAAFAEWGLFEEVPE